MTSERRVADEANSMGGLDRPVTQSTAKSVTFFWTPNDQGDLTEDQAISEARAILADPDAHEWLPWKASTTKPDA